MALIERRAAAASPASLPSAAATMRLSLSRGHANAPSCSYAPTAAPQAALTSWHLSSGPRWPDQGSRSSLVARAAGNGSRTETTTAPAWLRLDSPMLWMGPAEEALACEQSPKSPLCDPELSGLWKILLLSDGSVTRHLQILTGHKVHVDCLSMENIGDSLEGLPPGTDVIQGPRVQRQVLLRAGPERAPLVYASSWWNATEVDRYLQDRSKPIWVSLQSEHVELYREVQQVYHGHSKRLEQLLGCPGPFWGRQYFFWHAGKPLTLIYEVFSPRLFSDKV